MQRKEVLVANIHPNPRDVLRLRCVVFNLSTLLFVSRVLYFVGYASKIRCHGTQCGSWSWAVRGDGTEPEEYARDNPEAGCTMQAGELAKVR